MANYKKSEEMRSNILNAAKHQFLRKGYRSTNIKDIAEYLGVPRSLVYYYFSSKQEIMTVLYQDKFQNVESIASTVLERGKDPIVRLVLKYLIFRRTLLLDPMFKEFIIDSEFASLNAEQTEDQINRYYSDSRDAFEYFGMPVNSRDFLIHARMIEGVGRSLTVGEYFGTLVLTEYEAMEYLGKYAIMPTFGLTKKEYESILESTFTLVEKLKTD